MIAPAVAAGVVIYIMLIGYAIIRGEASDSLHSALWKTVKWSLVAAVALSAGGFNTYIAGSLNGLETALFQATTGANGGGELLDHALAAFIELFNQLVENVKGDGMGMFPNIAVCFAILLLALGCFVFFGLAVCVFMLAKVAGVLVLALGPAFIATLIFPPIQRFADAWLSAALNTVIIKVLAGIILTISTLFLKGVIDQVSGNFDTTAVLMDCLKIMVMSVSFGAIFGYLPMLSAQLVGGSPLPHLALPRLNTSGGQRGQPLSQPTSFSGGHIQHDRSLALNTGIPAYRRNVIGHLNR
ncbi:type IV secretion system protein [Asticcacaulis sp.]|uniref:type IV secretion system protein n=1 Tax=Asticcacaulis sp. TaxID=1872648 RepID=UPI003F7C88FC